MCHHETQPSALFSLSSSARFLPTPLSQELDRSKQSTPARDCAKKEIKTTTVRESLEGQEMDTKSISHNAGLMQRTIRYNCLRPCKPPQPIAPLCLPALSSPSWFFHRAPGGHGSLVVVRDFGSQFWPAGLNPRPGSSRGSPPMRTSPANSGANSNPFHQPETHIAEQIRRRKTSLVPSGALRYSFPPYPSYSFTSPILHSLARRSSSTLCDKRNGL